MLKRNLSKLNQAMGLQRSSSSSNKQKVQPDINGFTNGSPNYQSLDLKASYDSWMVNHPSALGSFDQMMKGAKGKKIVVFLDYDGTLSPIVDDPDCAFMCDEMRAAVREVAKYFPTAIITGRSRDKVKEFVQLSNVYYAGSHGMDIVAPARPVKSSDGKSHTAIGDKKDVLFQPAKKFLPEVQMLKTTIEERIKTIDGARVEDNKFCISVHYRHVKEEEYEALEQRVKSVLEYYLDFHLTWGKKVIEIRPSIEWNKGHAVEYLLETLGLSNLNDVVPLYIGDDRTDEDAFKVLLKRDKGHPIIVTSSPRETVATYSLSDTSEVLSFLLRLVRWRKFSSFSSPISKIWGLNK